MSRATAGTARRAWATATAAGLVAAGLSAGAVATGVHAEAALPQGVLVGDATLVTAVGLTDDLVVAQTADGISTLDRSGPRTAWTPVDVDGARLVGNLLDADSGTLLVDAGEHDEIAWQQADGSWSAREVPDGTVLGRGARYALHESTDGWLVRDARTGDEVWDYAVAAGSTAAIDGDHLWVLVAASAPGEVRELRELDLGTQTSISSAPFASRVLAVAPAGRWATVTTPGYPTRFVRDLTGVLDSWAAPYEDRDTFVTGRDVAVGLDRAGGAFVVADLGKDRTTTSYGPASGAQPDVDESGTSAVYVDAVGHARLVDLSGLPAAATQVEDHDAPNVPWVASLPPVSAGTTVVATTYVPTDVATFPFVAAGGVTVEMRSRQARPGDSSTPWSTPTAGTTRSVRAVDGRSTCFEARARDRFGNTSDWSQPECTLSDLAAPTLTKVSVPPAVIVKAGRATATVTYAATDATGIGSFDVRYKVWPRGSSAYGAWTYRSSFQGTTSQKASVTITTGQRICFAARVRDRQGHVSAWSSSRCLGTDTAAPKVTKVSVPRWRGVPTSGRLRSTVTFAGTDDRGVTSYDVRVKVARIDEGLGLWAPLASHTTKRSVTHTLRAGEEACYEVRARDELGRTSPWSAPHCTDVAAPVTAKGFTVYGKTKKVGGHTVAVLQNSVHHSGSSSASQFHQDGAVGIRLLVRTCPTCGTFDVQVGDKIMPVRTTSSTTGWKYVTLRWRDDDNFVSFDEVTPYPHERVTRSYIRSWVLLRH
ncbi:hypothetical protein [Cellulomonas sp. HZM]|uniref:hypothetical protein n=1 Tax=Cellulomonas sp. HZM TaxID=1454010 RepID=UPI0004936CC6|nr:hypothetical protein [Cellulomonas sp. HZM]